MLGIASSGQQQVYNTLDICITTGNSFIDRSSHIEVITLGAAAACH
jgi:hypothetical protein